MTVIHVINEKSPFWKMSPKALLNSSFEVIITLDSVIESTGNTTQARTSYLPSEILWGFRFENLMYYVHKRNIYAIDCASINHVVADSTPRQSPHLLAFQRQKKISTMSFNHINNNLSGSRLSIVTAEGRRASTMSYRVGRNLVISPSQNHRLNIQPRSVVDNSQQRKSFMENKKISEASLPSLEENEDRHASFNESNIAL